MWLLISEVLYFSSCEKYHRKNVSKYFKNDVDCEKVFGFTRFYSTGILHYSLYSPCGTIYFISFIIACITNVSLFTFQNLDDRIKRVEFKKKKHKNAFHAIVYFDTQEDMESAFLKLRKRTDVTVEQRNLEGQCCTVLLCFKRL
jgi:hypothetical protein